MLVVGGWPAPQAVPRAVARDRLWSWTCQVTTVPPGGSLGPSFFMPLNFKALFFGWNKSCCSYCVLNAKCTQVSTLLFFEIRRFAGSFFCLFHVIILLQLRQLRLRMKTPTCCFLLVLAWQDYLGRCTNSLSQIWVQSNFLCSKLSNLIAGNFSSLYRM